MSEPKAVVIRFARAWVRLWTGTLVSVHEASERMLRAFCLREQVIWAVVTCLGALRLEAGVKSLVQGGGVGHQDLVTARKEGADISARLLNSVVL